MAHTRAKQFWIGMVLHDLGVYLKSPLMVYCNNVSVIILASNHIYHACTKHIEVDYHFIREKVVRSNIHILFVGIVALVADILTKGLTSVRFQHLQSKLNVREVLLSLRDPCNSVRMWMSFGRHEQFYQSPPTPPHSYHFFYLLYVPHLCIANCQSLSLVKY